MLTRIRVSTVHTVVNWLTAKVQMVKLQFFSSVLVKNYVQILMGQTAVFLFIPIIILCLLELAGETSFDHHNIS